MKRIAIYARVSTTDQSTESQLLDLRRYTRERGWTIFKEYVDEGVSGTKDSRPALNELMNSAKKRRFDVVLVWRFDRFARSTKHLILALEEFKNLGIDFVERVKAGLRRARENGKRLGRPRKPIDRKRIRELQGQKKSLRQISQILGIPKSTIADALKAIQVDGTDETTD